MNILHIGEFDFTRTTGTGSSVLNLSLEQIKNYHKVGIMAPDTSSDKIDFKQILLFNMKTQKYNPFKVYRQDLKKIFHFQPDIVHFHGALLPRNTTIGKILYKENIPFIISPHGTLNPAALKLKSYFKKLLFLKLIGIKYLKKAKGFAAISEQEQEGISKFCNSKAIISIVHNAIERNQCELLYSRRESNLEKRGDTINIIFLGRYDPVIKGLDFLFNLIELLYQYNKNIELNLYGRAYPPKNQKLFDSLIRRMQVSIKKNLRIHEPVYGDEKVEVLARADICILTSRIEVFSMFIAEAMGGGIPVIVTESCDISNIVKKIQSGVVIPFDTMKACEKILELLSNREKLKNMGRNGYLWVKENLSPTIIADKTIELYSKVLTM